MATDTRQSAPYIFLSYASADRDRALHVADLLEDQGIAVWIDRTSIAGGTSWSAAIVRGIEVCKALVVLCSTAAMASPNVQQEIQLAWENRRPILPLILDVAPMPEAVRYALAGRQWIEILDHPEDDWLPRALRALTGLGFASPARLAAPANSLPGPAASPEIASPHHNLPAQLTSFIGRARERTEIVRRLTDATEGSIGARLLTLTGTGGCGKTRLALQVGADLLPRYPDGVWLVELAPIADPDLVGATVAAVLGIQNPADRPLLGHLVEALRPRRLLLLLDNCEHLLDASARLADALLRGCPNLQILATSREALGIVGEVSWRVPSLVLPPVDRVPSVPDLLRIETIQLFVERAQAVLPSFTLTSQNAPAVAEICRRLDGIPLALELAAARLKGLSAEQLAARLDQRFRLLTGGSRAALPRQQTLAAAVAWSYELLTSDEQTLFNRIAVFADGFTVEAAEAVGAADPGATTLDVLLRDDMLELLLRLVEKSLVVAEPGETGEDRYQLLETLRQYAREKFLATGESEVVSRRHASFYLAFAERAELELHGPEQADWFDRLEREHNNLRAAIEWLTANDAWVDALRLAGAIAWFWLVRGFYTEGRARLSAILARRGPAAPAIVRARACEGLSCLTIRQGDWSKARLYAEDSFKAARESENQFWLARGALALAWASIGTANSSTFTQRALALARTVGRPWMIGRALWYLFGLRHDGRDLVDVKATLAEGQAVSRQVGDAWSVVWWSRSQTWFALEQGDYLLARETAEETGRIARRLGDHSSLANALYDRGTAAFAEGDGAIALPCFAEARSIYRDVADRAGLVMAGTALSDTHLLLGELDAARDFAIEAVGLARETGSWSLLIDALHVSAKVRLARAEGDFGRSLLYEAVELGRNQRLLYSLTELLDTTAQLAMVDHAPGRALRLASAAAIERQRMGLKQWPIERARLAPTILQAEHLLSDAERSSAWAEGAAMTLEEATAYALDENCG